MRIIDITSCVLNDDGGTGTAKIKKTYDRPRKSSETTELERVSVVLGALALWTGVVLILWPDGRRERLASA